jgi:hypothetical protein
MLKMPQDAVQSAVDAFLVGVMEVKEILSGSLQCSMGHPYESDQDRHE